MRIYGKSFVENNKTNYKIIIDGKKEEIKEYINEKNKDILEIKLKEIEIIIEIRFCNQNEYNGFIIALNSHWKTKNVTDISGIFCYSNNLSSLQIYLN